MKKLFIICGGILLVSVLIFPAYAMLQLGDANGDGKVSMVDAMFIAQAAAGLRQLTPEQRLAADVNGDGKVTKYDAQIIASYVAGLIKSFDNVLKLGDLNGDGKVTAVDAMLAAQGAAGLRQLTPEQTLAADVDGDGKVTLADAKNILAYEVGLIKSLDNILVAPVETVKQSSQISDSKIQFVPSMATTNDNILERLK